VRGLAIAAITALSGLSLIGLASPASAATAKPYDFNGDGFTDVAIGSPYGTAGSAKFAGFVDIVYGSSNGLNTGKHQVFSQASAGIAGSPETSDHFGNSLTSADFDHDGFADLAVGVPDEDTADGANAGYLQILWGSAAGLSGTDSSATVEPTLTDPTTGEVIVGPGPSHRFGETLSVGDIDRNGWSDLFYSVPGAGMFNWFDFTPVPTAKAVAKTRTPHPGKGLAIASANKTKGEVTAQSEEDVNTTFFATGNVTGDNLGDLVVGWYDADGETVHGFQVLTGVIDPETGLGALDGTTAELIDTQVSSLTAGDFDGDGFDDVALGQTPDATHLGGQIAVYEGSATNVNPDAPTTVLNQGSPSVPGNDEAGDAFGASVAAGDVNKDGKADLAVGVPTEDVDSAADAGSAVMLYGSATGLTGAGSQGITQNTAGVPGGCETGDKMGTQVSLLDTNNDGFADLLAGAPAENAGDGMVSWLEGVTAGVTGTGSLGITATTFGVTGKKAEIGRRLGRLG
jgi:hypothetical protein